ncbi:uncharacterized protein [Gossypium hirsutum]|uniref:Uncharacterized protein n=1 Tax=Gossypium hirsutum TaxID=3635 RepID=A0ABM2ZDS5_GOSHI|nr:uncharacterized protein LOC107894128 [Gossypium hirsutum]
MWIQCFDLRTNPSFKKERRNPVIFVGGHCLRVVMPQQLAVARSISFLRPVLEKQGDLQQELKGNEVMAVLLEEEVENASLAELVEGHNSKHCNPKGQKAKAAPTHRVLASAARFHSLSEIVIILPLSSLTPFSDINNQVR